MAYQTGSVVDATALRDAITTFAVLNGWGWDATNEVLSLGNVVCKLTLPTTVELRIQGGTGIDVNGALVNPAVAYSRIKDLATTKIITWPVTYHLFVNTTPDDLVCLINFDAVYWEWLGLGQCNNLGVPGTAAWFGASIAFNDAPTISISASVGTSLAITPCAPFWRVSINDTSKESTSYLHCNLEGSDAVVHIWAGDANALKGSFFWGFTPLLERQPNTWNSEAILLPARIVVPRLAGLYSYAAEMPHARLLKVNNYNGGDLITLGPDTWFVAPFFRVNTVAQTSTDTGTWGWAIRRTL